MGDFSDCCQRRTDHIGLVRVPVQVLRFDETCQQRVTGCPTQIERFDDVGEREGLVRVFGKKIQYRDDAFDTGWSLGHIRIRYFEQAARTLIVLIGAVNCADVRSNTPYLAIGCHLPIWTLTDRHRAGERHSVLPPGCYYEYCEQTGCAGKHGVGMARRYEDMAVCGFCRRHVASLTRHHLIPRSQHGRRRVRERFDREQRQSATLSLCRACHNHIHYLFSEKRLALELNTAEKLLAEPEVCRFVQWLADKPPGFKPRQRRPCR